MIIAVREGFIDVKWGGKVLVCRPQDCRPHLATAFLIVNDSPQLQLLQEHLKKVYSEIQTVAWIHSNTGWQMSKQALELPQVFRAILFVAANLLHFYRCIGARIGRGYHTLNRLPSVAKCILMWWPTDQPALYQTFVHAGDQTIALRNIMHCTGSNDYSWIQFIGVEVIQARRIR